MTSRDASVTGVPTVGRKVARAVAPALAVVLLGFALTAWLISPAAALLVWIGLPAGVLLAVLLVPVRTSDLAARPDPAADYPAAIARFEAEAARGPALNPLCHPVLLGHGRRTPLAVVLLHGVSSCPRAFVDFAPMLHARGHTVLAPRMPENGLADRATDALRRLTAEELCRFGDAAVDIAAGLGERVVVLGISAGGTVAAWIGQNRGEAARVVLVAPMFGLARFGGALNGALMRLTLVMPDVPIWKDPALKARFQGMPHAYKRQSTRATGEILRLGYGVHRQAAATAPAAGAAALVTNGNDSAVDNSLAERFADAWARRGLPMTRYVFAKSHGLGHEIIDPLEPGADPALTYPVLVAFIEGGAPPSA